VLQVSANRTGVAASALVVQSSRKEEALAEINAKLHCAVVLEVVLPRPAIARRYRIGQVAHLACVKSFEWTERTAASEN